MSIQSKIDNALIAAQVKLTKLTEAEEGQNSIEYAGMIAVAGIIIGVIVGAASGWGDALVAKISDVISNIGGK